MNENEEKYEVVATKVKPEVKKQIAKICKAKRMTEYDMLQMMCDCIVRYMDDRHNLSPDLEQAMGIFEHMIGWADAYNLADPSAGMDVCQAVYVFQDPNGKKHGFRASMVDKPFFDQWPQTDNVIKIYERMTEVLLPELYRQLRLLAVEMECNSIVELLQTMIDAQSIINLSDEFKREFEDADRAANGKPVAYGKRTRRKKHMTPDNLPLFKRDISTEDMEREMGIRPLGGEW